MALKFPEDVFFGLLSQFVPVFTMVVRDIDHDKEVAGAGWGIARIQEGTVVYIDCGILVGRIFAFGGKGAKLLRVVARKENVVKIELFKAALDPKVKDHGGSGKIRFPDRTGSLVFGQ
jgi:hypothetical protein